MGFELPDSIQPGHKNIEGHVGEYRGGGGGGGGGGGHKVDQHSCQGPDHVSFNMRLGKDFMFQFELIHLLVEIIFLACMS